MSRMCRPSIFSSQLLRRSLALNKPSEQIHFYCGSLNKKCLCTSEKVNSCTLVNRYTNMLCNLCQYDPSLNCVKKLSTTVTTMAKNKPQKKKGASKKIDEDRMALLINIDAFKKNLEMALEDLRRDYIKHVSLRTSVGAIEQVPIIYKDEHCTLQEIAEIIRQPNLIAIDVEAFPDAVGIIMQALHKSHLNLNPQQEGTRIYLKIAKVTREHRESLAKSAKSYLVKCKDNIRNIRQKYVKQVTNLEKQPEDLVYGVLENIDLLIQKYVQEAENIYNEKQKEILRE